MVTKGSRGDYTNIRQKDLSENRLQETRKDIMY